MSQAKGLLECGLRLQLQCSVADKCFYQIKGVAFIFEQEFQLLKVRRDDQVHCKSINRNLTRTMIDDESFAQSPCVQKNLI